MENFQILNTNETHYSKNDKWKKNHNKNHLKCELKFFFWIKNTESYIFQVLYQFIPKKDEI